MMAHGNTKYETKYVLCQGLNEDGKTMKCPKTGAFTLYEVAIEFAVKHGFSHIAHVEDGKIVEIETVHADDR